MLCKLHIGSSSVMMPKVTFFVTNVYCNFNVLIIIFYPYNKEFRRSDALMLNIHWYMTTFSSPIWTNFWNIFSNAFLSWYCTCTHFGFRLTILMYFNVFSMWQISHLDYIVSWTWIWLEILTVCKLFRQLSLKLNREYKSHTKERCLSPI